MMTERQEQELVKKAKNMMEWVSQIDIMKPERKADQCFGILQGVLLALGWDYEEPKFEALNDYWYHLRNRIYGFPE